MRVPIDGGAPVILSQNNGYPYWIKVNSTAVYWTDLGSGSVYRFVLDGGSDGGGRSAVSSGPIPVRQELRSTTPTSTGPMITPTAPSILKLWMADRRHR